MARTSSRKAAEYCRTPKPASPMPATTLLPQGFFKALLCFCRECCVRDFADVFGKLARDFAHVIELLRIALAKRAQEIMVAQLDPHPERQHLVHPSRQHP